MFRFRGIEKTLLTIFRDSVDVDAIGARRNSKQRLSTTRYIASSSDLVPRYSGPPDNELSDEQRRIKREILDTRPRTGLSGPFGPWLAVPKIAQPSQELGAACRYGTSLSFRESELVILLTGARHQSAAEFDIHVPEALKAGLSMELITSIPRDGDFTMDKFKKEVLPKLENERERAIGLFVTEMLIHSTVSEEAYQSTKEILKKDSVLVEITSIVGYYTYVAYTLNVFNIPSAVTPDKD